MVVDTNYSCRMWVVVQSKYIRWKESGETLIMDFKHNGELVDGDDGFWRRGDNVGISVDPLHSLCRIRNIVSKKSSWCCARGLGITV